MDDEISQRYRLAAGTPLGGSEDSGVVEGYVGEIVGQAGERFRTEGAGMLSGESVTRLELQDQFRRHVGRWPFCLELQVQGLI